MRVYFDSSTLVCLYVAEPQSATLLNVVQALRRPILLNSLQEFEVRNDLQAQVARAAGLELVDLKKS